MAPKEHLDKADRRLLPRQFFDMDTNTTNPSETNANSRAALTDTSNSNAPRFYPWIILGVALLLGLAYVARFHGNPAGDPDSWGQFGDFLGGLLNPLVGIITVLLVLETLRITRREAQDNRIALDRQRDEMEKQTKESIAQTEHLAAELAVAKEQLERVRKREELQELQKCLDALTIELAGSLRDATTHPLFLRGTARLPKEARAGSKKYDAISEIDLGSFVAMRDKAALPTNADTRPVVKGVVSFWKKEFLYQIELVKEAAHYCLIFEQLAEDQAWSLYYYKSRAFRTAEVLAALGLVSDDVKIALAPKAFPAINQSPDQGPQSDSEPNGHDHGNHVEQSNPA